MPCLISLRLLYAFFWVITRRLDFICRRFGILCLFHLHRQVLTSTCLWRWNRQSVPKRPHIKSRRRVITQKKAYNIQNTAKAWNYENYLSSLSTLMYKKLHFVRYLFRLLSFVCVVICTIQQGGCAHTICSCYFAQQYLFFFVDDLKVILGNLCTGHIRESCLILKHFGP